MRRRRPISSDAVLEEGGKLCEEVLFPLNRSGDEEGCTFENGVVRTPKGFSEAYKLFREGGWTSLACDPDYGGQGLPHTLQFLRRGDDLLGQYVLRHVSRPLHGAYSALHRARHGERRSAISCRSSSTAPGAARCA